MNGSGTYLESTPYRTRDAGADSDLSRLTGGAGAGILDKVVARVKAKAESKGGNPMNAAAYNAYLDSYLGLVDKLDDTTRAQVGPEYAFLFKYIYPRVHELRKPDSAAQATALVAQFGNLVTVAENGTATQTQTQVQVQTQTQAQTASATAVFKAEDAYPTHLDLAGYKKMYERIQYLLKNPPQNLAWYTGDDGEYAQYDEEFYNPSNVKQV